MLKGEDLPQEVLAGKWLGAQWANVELPGVAREVLEGLRAASKKGLSLGFSFRHWRPGY